MIIKDEKAYVALEVGNVKLYSILNTNRIWNTKIQDKKKRTCLGHDV